MHPFSDLIKKKNKDIAVLLGSGPSINNITENQWDIISKHTDSWALNNWIYHPFFVPNFYHLELKHYNYNIIREYLEKKKELYENVSFIIPSSRKIKFPNGESKMLGNVFPEYYKNIYGYKCILRGKPTDKKINSNYNMNKGLTKSYLASISIMMEIFYKFGYKTVFFYGVDMNDSYYFWSDNKDIKKVHHRTNKEHEGKNPFSPHNTSHMVDFIIDFRDRWFSKKGINLYTGSTNGLLSSKIECKDISEIIL